MHRFSSGELQASLCVLLMLGCSGSSTDPNQDPPDPDPPVVADPNPIVFHCSKDASCPELLVEGDPHAGDRFRGYGDPSLEFDPATNTIWMTYSWLNVLISDDGPPPVFDLGVRTHLAKSVDGGNSFQFVRSVNVPTREAHPDTQVEGWSIHEVPTLVRTPDDRWELLWLKYFNPLGTIAGVDERQEFLYWKTTAGTPEELGDNGEVWARSFATSESWMAPVDLNAISELSDCVILSEPALFPFGNETYLASACLVVDGSGRRTDLERMVLLREIPGGYEFVGNILDGTDAARLGVDVIEQADISVARDGSIILIVTPIILGNDPDHQGCIVYEFENFASATLKRDAGGEALARNIITADGNGLGPGLCTYDKASDTGILLVITTITENGTNIEFSMRATGVHP